MKKIYVIFLLFIAVFSICTKLFSQQRPDKVIPYPALALEYQKYLGYPVSMATGIPDINIPLFDFKTGNYSIPLSLNYHSSGIKVTQSPGLAGYGWSLMPSFRITRIIHNRDDERHLVNTNEIRSAEDIEQEFANSNTYNIDPINNNIKYFEKIAHNGSGLPTADLIDTEYDIFTIQLPACSGNFILQNNNNTWQVVKINSNALKITPNIVNNGLDGFDVLDENGILYKFGYYPKENVVSEYTEYQYPSRISSSWMLYKIILPDSSEITFSYKSQYVHDAFVQWNRDIVTDNLCIPISSDIELGLSQLGIKEGVKTIDDGFDVRSYNCFPKAITSPSGCIDFEYESTDSYQLNRIVLRDSEGNEIKNIVLQREAKDNKLLGSVLLSDGGIYQLKYNPLNFSKMNAQDYWGYYNEYSIGLNFVPKMEIPVEYSTSGSSTVTVGWGNRGSSELHMQANILEKIIYPTGGYSSFTYEANRYYDNVYKTTLLAGGLRIKEIKTYDPISDKTIDKIYKYGENESGHGNITYVPRKEYFIKESIVLELNGDGFPICTYRQRETTPYSYLNFYLSTNTTIWYPSVTEYSEGGKTVYEYIYTPDELTDSRSYFDGNNLFIKHYYSYISSEPELIKKSVYKIENGVPTLVHEIANTYIFIEQGDPIKGLFVREYIRAPSQFNRRWHTFIDECGCPFHTHTSKEAPHGWYIYFYDSWFSLYLHADSPYHIFPHDNYYIHRGIRQLASTTDTEYSAKGNISKTKYYSYDNVHPYNLKMESERLSNNNTFSTKYYYPYENIAGVDLSMRNLLLANNRYSSVIQKETFSNTKLLNTERILYKDYGKGLILPSSVQTSASGATNLRTDITYDTYDARGNIRQVTTLDGISSVYLWSYNYQYPVAEIKNATYEQVKTALGENPDTLGISSMPLIMDKIDALRSKLPNAMVSTYTYKPLVGMLKANDPRGIATRFGYESFGRLAEIRDNEQYLKSDYIYRFANQQASGHPPIYQALNITLVMTSGENPTFAGTSGTFKATADGGSGQYKYFWYVNGVLKNESSNNQYTVEYARQENHTVMCKVVDLKTQEVVEKSTTVNIQYPQVTVKNITCDQNSAILKAEIVCDVETDITFILSYSKGSENRAEFNIGEFIILDESQEMTRTVKFRKGTTLIYIDLRGHRDGSAYVDFISAKDASFNAFALKTFEYF
ncbi:MAG: hypothetical protein LBV43_07685 [Prevotella sp.]|jgi:hypothetical protein|nr:hypothetical protein [Prevotella sp.]